jgi:hypothetical protein
VRISRPKHTLTEGFASQKPELWHGIEYEIGYDWWICTVKDLFAYNDEIVRKRINHRDAPRNSIPILFLSQAVKDVIALLYDKTPHFRPYL